MPASSNRLRWVGVFVRPFIALTITFALALPSPAEPAHRLVLPVTGQAIILPTPESSMAVSPSQVKQLSSMLANAASEGLVRPSHPAGPATISTEGGTQLVAAALAYARAVHASQLSDPQFPKNWGLRPATYDPLPSLRDALTNDTLTRWIAALPPTHAGYDGLRKGLARYQAIQAGGGWRPLSAGDDIVFGTRGPRVAELRIRLQIEDPAVPTSGDGFDLALLDAVRRAQRRYGIEPTGNVAAQTRAALDVPVELRIRQILANMERWRWLPRELPDDRVEVNIATAELTVFKGSRPILSMRAVTGRPEDETPLLQSQIHSVVLNPPWTVPASIATEELLPKERAHPGYLKRNDFKLIELADGATRLQQAPGSKSALGRYKFDFDNPYSVYLHDTPSQAAFSRFSRLASHGCVRLEEPAKLADLLLNDFPDWSEDRTETVLAKAETVRVRLAKPIAVFLLYWTAFPGTDGAMNFRADPYSWDTKLIDMLAGSPAPRH